MTSSSRSIPERSPYRPWGVSQSCDVSVLVVEDDPRFRRGLKTLLELYNQQGGLQFRVIGEAESRESAIALVTTECPDLILLDLELSQGQTEGLGVLAELKAQGYAGKTLVLSSHRESELIFRAMQAGAWGYVLKEAVATQLPDAIATVLHQQIYLAPEVITRFFQWFHAPKPRSPLLQALHLTEREQEVLTLLVEGASNQTIAQTLYITAATVKAHLTSIYEKLGVKSRTQAIATALKSGFVSDTACRYE